ncbi:hypothetical protein LPJ75_005093 [Coemansia sp. RSA 2598]|nr:hypothetical protein LPJ75_005093 [Coemansia sp. RSA 2598]
MPPVASIHQQLMDPAASAPASTTQAPPSLMSLGLPLTPITGGAASAALHAAPSLSISASRPEAAQPRLSVTVRPQSVADIPSTLEEASRPPPACAVDMDIDAAGADVVDLTESASTAAAPMAHRRHAGGTKRRLSLETLEIGDPEQIPSIGRFDTLRQLFDYKERCKQYDVEHGTHWREKMDSKRRQNWSRITAVYNHLVRLRGPGAGKADLERAIRETASEMETVKMTLPQYSQLVRKRLNNERKQSSASQRKADPARAGDQDQDQDQDQERQI